MAGKARVHELAKELGVESKVVLAKLKEMGEFVKSASSTVEAPVARKLKEAFPPPPQTEAAQADGAATPARKPRLAEPTAVESVEPADQQGVEIPTPPAPPPPPLVAPAPTPPGEPTAPPVPKPAAGPEQPDTAPPRPIPRPGNNPFGVTPPTPPMPPRGSRPAQGGQSAGRQGAPRTGGQGARPTGRPSPGGMPPRPNPGMMPQRPARPASGRGSDSRGGGRPGGSGGGRSGGPVGGRSGGPGGRSGSGGSGPRTGAGTRGGGGGGAGGGFGGRGQGSAPPTGGPPGAGAGAGGGGFGGRGRGGGTGGGRGRGGTGGAFGRGTGRGGRSRKGKKQRRQELDNLQAPTIGGVQVPRGNGQVIRLPRGASLTDFAERVDANPASLVQVLFHLGEMVTATQSVSDETLELLGSELGYTVHMVSPEDEDRELLESFDLTFGEDGDDDSSLQPRPPVVTVMGHVDHGKTKLLDAIRQTDVAEGEAGGITQHIGAYQVTGHVGGGDERKITFIDTPGHEAFTAMRARGAQSTDIVVLVVAADDGVMPQTIEALNHAQAAEVPIVVAVNKVDKEGANPAKVRQQLTEYGLVAEEYGGDTMFVDISAKQLTGIDDLLEAILLTADATLNLRANPNQPAQGISIEAHLDRGRGAVATVLVQRGMLRVGDAVVAGDAFGRVRRMLDDTGSTVEEAGPSRPVLVLGFTSVPSAGDSFLVVEEDRVARQIAERRQARERNAQLAQSRRRISLEDLDEVLGKSDVEQLNLIIKGDVSGSVEALEDALLKIDVGNEVSLRIVHRGVGGIKESDINLAAASNAVVIGFNVRPEGRARELADREGIDIRYYSIIYQAIEEIEAALKGMLKPEFEEAQLGTAEVREVFRVPRIGNIAGCIVRSGTIVRNSKARLVRDGVVAAEGLTVESLKRFKEDATEVREGFECGVGLGAYNDIQVGDVIETYEMREKPRR